MERPDLLNCNKHGAIAALLPFRPSPFRIKFPSTFHVFSGTAPGHNFFTCSVDLIRKSLILGPPSKSNGVQNGTPNRPSCAKLPPKQIRWATCCVLAQKHCAHIAFGEPLVSFVMIF
jgi:hypothetical protein